MTYQTAGTPGTCWQTWDKIKNNNKTLRLLLFPNNNVNKLFTSTYMDNKHDNQIKIIKK